MYTNILIYYLSYYVIIDFVKVNKTEFSKKVIEIETFGSKICSTTRSVTFGLM